MVKAKHFLVFGVDGLSHWSHSECQVRLQITNAKREAIRNSGSSTIE